MTRLRHVQTAALALSLLALDAGLTAQTPGERWVGTWATAEVGRPQTPPPVVPGPPPFMPNQCPANPAPAAPGFLHFSNQTLRQIVHASLGGTSARVVLSNKYGTAPLAIGAAHVALRDREAAIRNGSDRALTFGGASTVTIPPGAMAYSDPVSLTIPDMSDLAIDLFLPGDTNGPAPLTMHNTAVQTSYVSRAGNHAGATALPVAATTQNWFVIHRVDVSAAPSAGGLVVYGDSITDGTRSTPDTNNRWPDQLVRRMLSASPPLRLGVMNGGIAGNRVLSDANFAVGINALARFEHDVAAQPGVTHVIFMEGINDIGQARESAAPSAGDVIAGHRQIIAMAHARGLTIIGATLTPFYGAAYYTDVGEAKRQAVNQWIRTSRAYDAVVDFDQATRDPGDPKKLLPAYDSCDHLHPSDAGYKAMADAVDLKVLRAGR
ncbi:MAG: SGNH/GDSL hydrolase family protein [Acidobacteria bacterium]|nr:SGNH/GDSL hydrolase family protein [Acidobacteriota bacterium]